MYFTPSEQKRELFSRLVIISLWIAFLLTLGTIVYHFAEGWSYMDSLYFATISLTSRGFSEQHPSNWFSVLFSVFYLLIGVSVIIYSLSSLVAYYTAFYQDHFEHKVRTIVKKIKTKKEPERPNKWIVIKPKQ